MALRDKLIEWDQLKSKLATVKESEMELRKEIVEDLTKSNPGEKYKGTVGDLEVEAKRATTTAIEDKDELMEDWESLAPEIQDCFPLKPSFSKTAYNKLDDDSKGEVDVYLIEKPAAPSLSVKFKQ